MAQINSSRIPRTRGKKRPHKEDKSGWPPEKTKACRTLHKATAFYREQINHGMCANVNGSLGAAVMAEDCLATSKTTTNLLTSMQLSCAQLTPDLCSYPGPRNKPCTQGLGTSAPGYPGPGCECAWLPRPWVRVCPVTQALGTNLVPRAWVRMLLLQALHVPWVCLDPWPYTKALGTHASPRYK